jgi:hypothetical protein
MKRVIVFWLIIGILMGVNFMSFLNETSGKVRMKPLTIGDGVDKVHSPLQVSPNMATDMLNLSSKDFPTLTQRYGRDKYPDIPYTAETVTETYTGDIKPYMSSNGELHYLMVTTDTIPIFYWYIVKNYTQPAILLYSDSLVTINVPSYKFADTYTTGNFSEFNGQIFFCYFTYNSIEYVRHIISYDMDTQAINDTYATITGDDTARLSPSAIYYERLFLASDSIIYFSEAQEPTDFTSIGSGTIFLKQGGRPTALIPMRDRMIISTATSLFVLMGNTKDSYSIHLLSDNLGIRNPKGIVQKNGVVYFIGTDYDIYEYNGNTLLNISREPIDTGSKSGVKGGFDYGLITTDSLAIENNMLYCTGFADNNLIYVFDLNKRRWYIEDYPFDSQYIIAFSDTTRAYYMGIKLTGGTYATVTRNLILANNKGTIDQYIAIDTAGTKQKETNTIVGTVAGASGVYCTVTLTHDLFYGTNRAFGVSVTSGDNATTVATKIKDTLLTSRDVYELFNITTSGANLILESKYAIANESSFNVEVKNGTCTGLTTTNSANTTAGVSNTYKLVDYTPTEYFWQSPCYQLDTTGRQLLKSVHFSYYSPNGTEIGLYISKTVDGDDFERVATLPTSALKQSQKFVLPINRYRLSDWVRIKIQGHGAIEIYNMTMEWRVLGKLR